MPRLPIWRREWFLLFSFFKSKLLFLSGSSKDLFCAARYSREETHLEMLVCFAGNWDKLKPPMSRWRITSKNCETTRWNRPPIVSWWFPGDFEVRELIMPLLSDLPDKADTVSSYLKIYSQSDRISSHSEVCAMRLFCFGSTGLENRWKDFKSSLLRKSWTFRLPKWIIARWVRLGVKWRRACWIANSYASVKWRCKCRKRWLILTELHSVKQFFELDSLTDSATTCRFWILCLFYGSNRCWGQLIFNYGINVSMRSDR